MSLAKAGSNRDSLQNTGKRFTQNNVAVSAFVMNIGGKRRNTY